MARLFPPKIAMEESVLTKDNIIFVSFLISIFVHYWIFIRYEVFRYAPLKAAKVGFLI